MGSQIIALVLELEVMGSMSQIIMALLEVTDQYPMVSQQQEIIGSFAQTAVSEVKGHCHRTQCVFTGSLSQISISGPEVTEFSFTVTVIFLC
mgnify:CR=1 FL=1